MTCVMLAAWAIGELCRSHPARGRVVGAVSYSFVFRMNQHFTVLSLAHPQAPLAVRERLALTEPDCRALLRVLSQKLGLTALLVLSTCNRTEVYYRAAPDQSAAVLGALAELKNLPDASGLSLMEELRARYGLRGIALTGYGQEEDQRRSREAGFVAHLTKPIDIDQLRRALATFTSGERPVF